jgi:hypothetical protein
LWHLFVCFVLFLASRADSGMKIQWSSPSINHYLSFNFWLWTAHSCLNAIHPKELATSWQLVVPVAFDPMVRFVFPSPVLCSKNSLLEMRALWQMLPNTFPLPAPVTLLCTCAYSRIREHWEFVLDIVLSSQLQATCSVAFFLPCHSQMTL